MVGVAAGNGIKDAGLDEAGEPIPEAGAILAGAADDDPTQNKRAQDSAACRLRALSLRSSNSPNCGPELVAAASPIGTLPSKRAGAQESDFFALAGPIISILSLLVLGAITPQPADCAICFKKCLSDMSTVRHTEIEFFGGPCDGHRQAIRSRLDKLEFVTAIPLPFPADRGWLNRAWAS
ncbi:MAG TPA: hypothetical protein VHB99_03615 [Pirellulales bacterium]|nr:hypothetical protein [Pirellulales bacterium]